MMTRFTNLFFFLSLLTLTLSVNPRAPVPFRDVSEAVGFVQPAADEQFGGATVADLDSDGHYDFLLTYHNQTPMRLFFGTPSGNFQRSPFIVKADIHGVSVAPRTARSSQKIIAVSIGGGRGTNLRPPYMFLARPSRRITNITQSLGFGQAFTRGRVAVHMDMSMRTRRQMRANGGGPDVLFVNLLGNNPNLTHFAYQNNDGEYELKEVPGFSRANEERAIVTDIDNDGIMELVHFSVLRIFKLTAPFQFQDVTRQVWPGFRDLKRSVSAVVELDFNNDGLMDLYIARARSLMVTPRGPPSVPEHGDLLLMNRGGTYVDVGARAGIPTDSDSMGVTAEDFNNDGYVDVLITTFEGPDILLVNRGNGTFRQTDPRTAKRNTTRGANVMAVDYNLDGRVDYIAGQGFRALYFGNYRLMRNQMRMTAATNYLLVRVGNEPSLACTSLNALVTVFMPNGRRQVRRVGGRGAQAGGLSYIDTVHFGLGRLTTVTRVTVTWTTGAFQVMRAVESNQKISFGRFP